MATLCNLGDLIDRTRDQDKRAVIDLGADGNAREFSYADMDRMSAATARALLASGLRRGDRVAILAANCAESLCVIYAAMRAGLVAVPVNFKFPRDTIDFILRDSGSRIVFCDAQRRDSCPADVKTVVFGGEGVDGFNAFMDAGPFHTVVPQPGETAMFLYTSGSTGKPKGVILSHESHLWVVRARLGGQDLARHRYLIAAPLYHMNALALSQLACAAHATIVLLPQFASKAYVQAIGKYRCTWLTAVPPMVAMMLRDPEALAHADFSSVEYLRMGSAPVSASLLDEIRAAMPHAQINNAYGTTEGGPVVFGPHPDGIKPPALSVGYPHPQVQLRLVADGNMDAAEGVLQLRCPGLMTGYHNRPDLPLPITSDGYYVTGDVFRRDDNGFHYFVGRVDDMFVCGGENIYPGEVEKMLETHPDIDQACVVPMKDDVKGHKPVAFCVLRPGTSLTENEVKQYALAKAPPYQHPRIVRFLESLPLASTNKVDRKALASMMQGQ